MFVYAALLIVLHSGCGKTFLFQTLVRYLKEKAVDFVAAGALGTCAAYAIVTRVHPQCALPTLARSLTVRVQSTA